MIPIIHTLATIGLKPGISPGTNLIVIRRICRRLCEVRETIHDERRALRREAGKQRAFLPFTAARVEALEKQASEHRGNELKAIRPVLAGFGRDLLLNDGRLTDALGFDRLCDLLNINPVHRDQARRAGHTSVRELAFVEGLEDSADRHDPDWKDGPLFSGLPCRHDGAHQGNANTPAARSVRPGRTIRAEAAARAAPRRQVAHWLPGVMPGGHRGPGEGATDQGAAWR